MNFSCKGTKQEFFTLDVYLSQFITYNTPKQEVILKTLILLKDIRMRDNND